MSAPAARILRELDLQQPVIRRAFLDWVEQTAGRARVTEVERLIAAGQLGQLPALLGLDATSLAGIVESVRSAAVAGGMFEARHVRGLALGFDMRHREAERWLSRHAGRLVTEILADQRALIESTVTMSVEIGRGPRQAALDLVGRVERATGRRTGGIIGLTRQQGEYVISARRELATMDPHYFTRARRDRRFDRLVRKAMDGGKPLSAADIDRITGRYADRLLAYRGETIARTEALTGFSAGRDLVFAEAIADGRLNPRHVTKTWKTAQDGKVRDSHAALEGATVAVDAAFTAPTGSQMRYPGDTELGASAADTIQCRCTAAYTVDHLAALGG